MTTATADATDTTTTTDTATVDTTTTAPDWRAGLPDDLMVLDSDGKTQVPLKSHRMLESFKDVTSLAKSYYETKKMVGAKPQAVKVPDANSPADEWAAFRTAMGVPETPDKYGLKLPEVPDSLAWDDNAVGSFLKTAHEAGVPPFAAQKLINWYAQHFGEMSQAAQDEANAVNAQLRQEWGVNYEAHLGRANRALQEFGGDELVDYLIKSGLGRDPRMVKAWANVGNALVEHGAMAPTGNHVSPEEALTKIQTIMADPKHPANDASNPSHERALEELLALRRAALGRDNQVLTTF